MSTQTKRRPPTTRMVCPDCGRRGVAIDRRSESFDCRYCEFYAFTDGDYPDDVLGRRNLASLNPGHPLLDTG